MVLYLMSSKVDSSSNRSAYPYLLRVTQMSDRCLTTTSYGTLAKNCTFQIVFLRIVHNVESSTSIGCVFCNENIHTSESPETDANKLICSRRNQPDGTLNTGRLLRKDKDFTTRLACNIDQQNIK